jgi:hypothetical protein
MARVTINLDDETAALAKAREWPASVRALAGAWPDFTGAEEIRKDPPADLPREQL